MAGRMTNPCAMGLALVAACSFDSTGGGASHGAGSSTGAREDSSSTTASPHSDTAADASAGAEADATTATTHGLDSSSSVGEGEASETTTGTPACELALWVTGNTDVTSTVDAPLFQRMLDLGFSITVVDKPASSADDVADNCVIVISDIGSSGDVNTKFRDVPVGVIVLEPGLYHFMAMVPSSSDAWWGDDDGLITIVAPEHPMAAGLDGTVAIYEGPARGNHASPVESAQVVAIWGGDPQRATLMGFETGAQLAHGHVAPARRVGFPGGTAPTPMSAERIDLFEATVRWAAGDP